MEYLDQLHAMAESAYGYLNTQEGILALVGVGSVAAAAIGRLAMTEFVLPVLKKSLSLMISLFRSKPSELLQEVLKSLDDSNAVLNESLTGSNPDELMTGAFIVKYDRLAPTCDKIKAIQTGNRNVVDVLTNSEKKTVVKKLAKTVARVKLRDWTNQRMETLRVLTSEQYRSDASRRV